jgi:class 3 adenylate cyclase
MVSQPGQIVMGESTRAAIAAIFPTEQLGSFQLKGLQEKVPAFRLRAEDLPSGGAA